MTDGAYQTFFSIPRLDETGLYTNPEVEQMGKARAESSGNAANI